MTKFLISPEMVSLLTDTVGDVVGDGARIFLLSRHRAPALFGDSTPDVLFAFLARVLDACAARADGAAVQPAAAPAADAVLAEEVLRSIARWPREREAAAHAWQLALNLTALDPTEGV